MRFIDDEQYYRWLRVSLTFSIILLMLAAPGLTLQELEFAGVKFGVAGTNLLRLLVLCGASYSVLQFWVTSWMASRRATLFSPPDDLSVASRAKVTAEAARKRIADLRSFASEIEKLPMLSGSAAVRIELGGLEFTGSTQREAFTRLRSQLREAARAAVAEAHGPDEPQSSDETLDRIAGAAADLIADELYDRFCKSFHSYDTRVQETAFRLGQLDGLFKGALESSRTNLDDAVRLLAKLHATLTRLDMTRDAKFLFLEIGPTSLLFVAAAYHYAALYNPRWQTIFQHITP